MKAQKYNSNLISEVAKTTSLESRIRVLTEMGFIDLICELGFREKKAWSDEEDPLLNKILDLAKNTLIGYYKNLKSGKKMADLVMKKL